MYTVANGFLKVAKDARLELKAFFLSIERGWVYYRDEPLVPVFLVPSKNDQWLELADLLLGKLKESYRVDWLVRASGAIKPDLAFLKKWVETMKLEKELADAILPNLSLQEEVDTGAEGAQAEEPMDATHTLG
jgi:hypothetical protein